jgi:SAM-dependent methyltransferase
LGGSTRQRAQLSTSVPARGNPHRWQPELPSHSIFPQQARQKAPTSSMTSPQPAHRGGKAKSRTIFPIDRRGRAIALAIALLSREAARRTSAPVTDLFDRRLRALRRDRAARMGPELFLLDRAFDECLDRLGDIARPFNRALLLGCPSPEWPSRLGSIAATVDVRDPGHLFATRAGGLQVEEDRFDFGEGDYDLCVTVGTLDTVNDLPLALQLVRRALRPDGLLIGAMAGGNSLPSLRSSLIEAGRAEGRIVARAHPRIEAPSLAGLLTAAGFVMPVVDIDRVQLRYQSFEALVRDLRAMGSTSVLTNRPPPLRRSEVQHARKAFEALRQSGRTEETVEILHFLGWHQISQQGPH